MILIALLSVALVTPPQDASKPSLPSHSLPDPDQVRRAVVACGLSKPLVKVAYDRDMQEDVIWISRRQRVHSRATMACIARTSLKVSLYVYFRDDGQQQRYMAIYTPISDEANVVAARTWLADRHLLVTMPLPAKGAPVLEYTTAIEEFCDVKKGALLTVYGDNMITFANVGVGKVTPNGIENAAATENQFECITNALSAADLKSRGLFFGFIGNAAATR